MEVYNWCELNEQPLNVLALQSTSSENTRAVELERARRLYVKLSNFEKIEHVQFLV